jgi:hypothetical protein
MPYLQQINTEISRLEGELRATLLRSSESRIANDRDCIDVVRTYFGNKYQDMYLIDSWAKIKLVNVHLPVLPDTVQRDFGFVWIEPMGFDPTARRPTPGYVRAGATYVTSFKTTGELLKILMDLFPMSLVQKYYPTLLSGEGPASIASYNAKVKEMRAKAVALPFRYDNARDFGTLIRDEKTLKEFILWFNFEKYGFINPPSFGTDVQFDANGTLMVRPYDGDAYDTVIQVCFPAGESKGTVSVTKSGSIIQSKEFQTMGMLYGHLIEFINRAHASAW